MRDHEPIRSELAREDADFIDIVQEFVNNLPGRIEELKKALEEADFERLRMKAHRLKGGGGSYGYPALTERAARLEAHARQGALDRCRQAFEELQLLAARVVVL